MVWSGITFGPDQINTLDRWSQILCNCYKMSDQQYKTRTKDWRRQCSQRRLSTLVLSGCTHIHQPNACMHIHLSPTSYMLNNESCCCKGLSVNTAQEEGNRRKRTSDRARTRDLHFFVELQPHEPSVPATNPSSPITLCTGRRCAAIQRPLEDLRFEAGTVCDGNGLSG